jgi:hypothetical protein
VSLIRRFPPEGALAVGDGSLESDRSGDGPGREREGQSLRSTAKLATALASARTALLPIAVGAVFACEDSHSGAIDHKIDPPQDIGIWSRSNQKAVQDSRLGHIAVTQRC